MSDYYLHPAALSLVHSPDLTLREPYRPVVVIDPEDREAVTRLLETYGRQFTDWTPELDSNVTRLQTALREFANPTPSKPDEPTGHYAVVEDEAGQEWCRIDPCNGYVWQLLGQPSGQCRYAEWKHIAAVRVLSEGVAS